MFKKTSLEERNKILESLYVHSVSSNSVECQSLLTTGGFFEVDVEQFSSQLLVAVNCLSSDDAGIEAVRHVLV